MQTIVYKDTNKSVYIFEDDTVLVSTENEISTPSFDIMDLNSDNSIIFTDVTPPEDWTPSKYIFDGTTWEINSLYALTSDRASSDIPPAEEIPE